MSIYRTYLSVQIYIVTVSLPLLLRTRWKLCYKDFHHFRGVHTLRLATFFVK